MTIAYMRIAKNLARFIALLTAQRICAISSSTDKKSNHSFAKLSAWYMRAQRHASGRINTFNCTINQIAKIVAEVMASA